jgi:hypothetical protein
MFLSNNLKSLTVETNATATTTEPSYSSAFVDTVENGSLNPGDNVGALTGSTAVAVVGAMPNGTKLREIKGVHIFNRDTVSHTITVKKVNNGTGYTVAQVSLGTLESLVYDGTKWMVFSAAGELKSSALGAATSTAGTKNGDTVTATEAGTGVVHQTTLTLTDVAQAVVNGTEYQSTLLYTFPEGRIFVLGCVATLAQKTTSAILSTLNGSSTGSVALGSVAASNVSLTSTMVDIAPATAFTSSATINVAGTAVSPVLAAAAQFDGTAAAKAVYLNSAYATTTDVDADATQTFTGTVVLTWINLGDK